jgi:hypothetical protein
VRPVTKTSAAKFWLGRSFEQSPMAAPGELNVSTPCSKANIVRPLQKCLGVMLVLSPCFFGSDGLEPGSRIVRCALRDKVQRQFGGRSIM